MIDVSCGDGRFLQELHKTQPEVGSLGINYSAPSMPMANGMSPHFTYEARDILEEGLGRVFHVATYIEVLEHTLPEDCAAFIEAIAEVPALDGELMPTAPHVNKRISNKQYQHFSLDKLADLLNPQFKRIKFIPSDRESKVSTTLELAVGGRGNQFLINSPAVLNRPWGLYERRYLYANTESNRRRITAVCER